MFEKAVDKNVCLSYNRVSSRDSDIKITACLES